MIEKATQQVASNTTKITGNIIRMASLFGGIIGGGLGLAGLAVGGAMFGMDKIAGNVTSARATAIGSGVSYGERRSFQTNFGRILGSGDQFLGGVSTALNSADKSALFAGGLRNPSDLQGGTAEVSLRLLQSLKGIADSSNPNNLLQTFNSRQIGQFMTFEQFQTLAKTQQSELSGLASHFKPDAKAMDLGGTAQTQWADLNRTLEQSENIISRVFIQGLTKLTPLFDRLSQSLTLGLTSFFDNPDFQKGLDKFGDGVESIAKYMGTTEFQEGIKNFATGVIHIGQLIGKYFGTDTPQYGSAGIRGRNHAMEMKAQGRRSSSNLAAARANGSETWYGQFASYVLGIGAGPNVKPGAGTLTPQLSDIAARAQRAIPGLGIVTSGDDEYHRRVNPSSAHARGMAVDFRATMQNHASVTQELINWLKQNNIKGRVIDEFSNPSKNATAGHIHLQIDNKAGSDLNLSASATVPVTGIPQ